MKRLVVFLLGFALATVPFAAAPVGAAAEQACPHHVTDAGNTVTHCATDQTRVAGCGNTDRTCCAAGACGEAGCACCGDAAACCQNGKCCKKGTCCSKDNCCTGGACASGGCGCCAKG